MNRKELGKIGEALACKHLKRQRYTIVAKNYSTPIGEIDIIAEDGHTLVFIEVKSRRSKSYGLPEEAITSKKVRKLTRLAQLYIKDNKAYNRKARFDVVSIMYDDSSGRKTIRLIKNAFYAEE